MVPTREQAWEILTTYTKTESLLKHAQAVEASMRAYAEHFGEDVEKWGVTGLLHDFDYEQFPETHPQKGVDMLREKGIDEDILEAIMGHAVYTGVPRTTLMAKALFAVDELSGFVTAVAYVRPNKLEGMKPKSVKKKLKTPAFAAKVNRDEIKQGIEELGVDTDEHITRVIAALQGIQTELGLG